MLTQDAKAKGIWNGFKNSVVEIQENPKFPPSTVEAYDDINTVDNEDGPTVTADLEDLTVNELKKIAEEKGIEIKFGTKKADIIEMLKK